MNTIDGMPGRYKANPETLLDGQPSALLVGQTGILQVELAGGSGGDDAKVTVTGSGGDVATHDSQGDDIPSTAIGLTTEALNWHWSVSLASWSRNYGDTYTNIPNAVSVPFTGARLYALNGSNAVPLNADAAGALQTHQVGNQVTPTNPSGTITTGNTAQQLMAANPNRRGFWIQNVSTEDLWINELGTAVIGQPSMKLLPDALYESKDSGVPTSAISIIGATTGQQFSAREW